MQNFLIALFTCSVSMSALILIYIATGSLIAKRYSAKQRYYAWLVIVIGLIIPFRPQFRTPVINFNIPVDIPTIEPYVQGDFPSVQYNNKASTAISVPPAQQGFSWWEIAAYLWIAGMVSFFTWQGLKHYRFMRMVERWGELVTSGQMFDILQRVTTEKGISDQITLYMCPFVGSPMLIGLAHPKILLSKADFFEAELELILEHELVHYKRRDLWYKCLVLIAAAMHWFNPVIYFMAKAIEADCELSCDAEIVRSADENARQYYIETIIGVVKYQSRIKTALSTNFYGGKKGMKKRILSIMDMGKKKTGIAVVCTVLIITLGTGFAFAANASSGIPQANGNVTVYETDTAYNKSAMYERYAVYGLNYNKTSDCLYFNGELVRYFEDWYPVNEDGNAYAGVDYFNENGTVDAHGVRDLSQIVHNADGSYDPSGKLIGVTPYSQAEFDERDIDKLIYPPQHSATTTSSKSYSDNTDYSVGSDFTFIGESREAFKKYAEFGLTCDDDNVFRYQGKMVRRFADLGGGMAFTRLAPNDYEKSVDLTAIRDANENLTGVYPASKEEFNQRTERIEQSQREQDEFLKNHPTVTAYSAAQTAENELGISNGTGTTYNIISQETSSIRIDNDNSYATSYNPNYTDNSLSSYAAYGVSYNNISKTWIFNDKPVGFLVDSGYQIYVNFPYDNTADNFAEKVAASNNAFLKVIRKSDSSIDKIIEMTADEAEKEIKAIFKKSIEM